MPTAEDVFASGGLLSRCFPSFEHRAGQEKMAAAVAAALDAEVVEDEEGRLLAKILVVEAETGIGKTLAYLVPAALCGKRVVISTATLNLQDQICDKDIPLVEKILGEPLSALVMKGRENYLCLYRWYQYRLNPQLKLVEDARIAKMERWLEETVWGDRAELTWLGERDPLWMKLTANSAECLGGDCPEYENCYITRLRKEAGNRQLLVVNHHLFFSDLALRKDGFGELLPRYEAVIFDEAHHIENVASVFFGKSWSQYQVVDLLSDIEPRIEEGLPEELAADLREKIWGLRKRIDNFAAFFPVRQGRYPLAEFIADQGEGQWLEQMELVALGLTRLFDVLSDFFPYGDEWGSYAKRAEELRAKFLGIAAGEDNEYIRWYERRERSLLISATPIDVAPLLQENLYTGVHTCVLTSATLSSGGSFSYQQKRLGLGDDVEIHTFYSPFDYASRSLRYIPPINSPEPASPLYSDFFARQTIELLYHSQGRALVLCTSFRAMEEIADALEDTLDYPVLVQGMEAKAALLNRFRAETHSVLVAVASFWEGVDIPGESLSCVVIDKLPFEVPSDPVLQARIARIKEEGGNPFFSFQVPRAVLTLRQGVGRLMRTSSDWGVVAIMDVRLLKKGYGKVFLRSLPPSPQTYNMDEVGAFFQKKW